METLKIIKVNTNEKELFDEIWKHAFTLSSKVLYTIGTDSNVYRGFSCKYLENVLKYGNDRKGRKLSPHDPYPDSVYASKNLSKALEYAEKHFRKEGKACIAVYDEKKMQMVDFYTYKFKTDPLDALKAVIILTSE